MVREAPKTQWKSCISKVPKTQMLECLYVHQSFVSGRYLEHFWPIFFLQTLYKMILRRSGLGL